ncbi:hypothetical protein F3Y22_tig00111693pilonHSYRG00153 [Hibiscus syriacus]|uniref:Uncharacterized protein n=1 Tax=Hibiscus syriacus TaxID=106335 RepID=A0A6A2XI28_HIBSY|nr:hypothetical protein F3Y22_tig00111693pilonHSYRG00153 [Hibiscus syriacus]
MALHIVKLPFIMRCCDGSNSSLFSYRNLTLLFMEDCSNLISVVPLEALLFPRLKNFKYQKAWLDSSAPFLNASEKFVGASDHSERGASTDDACSGSLKAKRKKLKGKRAVVRWLKFFRWKKRDYERMTAEEKILYKLRKAQKKEERLVTALNKIEPAESSETTHDPEILTPEEHFFFLKMGLKCKNYVPVGRRGIYQALDKSKYRDGLRAVRKYIPKLEQDLELLRAQAVNNPNPMQHVPNTDNLNGILGRFQACNLRDSEDLSDIFETESDTETEEREEQPLFLDEFDKFPKESDGEPEDFEEHLRQISMAQKFPQHLRKMLTRPTLMVDRIFLRAASLLRKKGVLPGNHHSDAQVSGNFHTKYP